MLYSCSWPDYERSESIPVNYSLVAEHCNTWRVFWDVQNGQYAKTQAHRYDLFTYYILFVFHAIGRLREPL